MLSFVLDMTKLTTLDLSSNNIAIISTGALVGLRLNYLYLEENHYIKLTTSSFVGMSTEILNLAQCKIEHLTADIFQPLLSNNKLRRLMLQGNKVARFDRSMLDVFSKVEAIRIYGNPLICDCQSKWLKEFYDLNSQTTIIRDAMEGTKEEPRCDGPDHVTGQYFDSLSAADFSCDMPTLQADLSFSLDKGTLACISRGTPLPKVSWYRPNGVVVEKDPIGNQDSIRNEIELLADEPGTLGQYRCVASNDGGNISLSVNVDWPFQASSAGGSENGVGCNSQATSKDVILSNPTSEADAETHYLKIKYFTLVDMVGAILGTFVSTLIITVVTLHFCVYRRKKATQYSTPVMSEYSSSSNGSDKNGPYPVSLHSLQASQMQAQRPLPNAPNKPYHKIYDENHYMATNIEERDEFLRFSAQQAGNGRITPGSSACDTCTACRTIPHSHIS